MNFTPLVISIVFGTSSLLLAGCNNDNSGPISSSVTNEADLSAINQNSWETRLSSYAEAESLPLDEAKRRLDIMDSSSAAMVMASAYMKDSMGGAYFGMQEDNFSLNILSNRVGDLTALDQEFLNRVQADTGVPLHMVMNSSHNLEQMDSFLDSISKDLSTYNISNVTVSYNPESNKMIANIYGEESNSDDYLNVKNSIIHNTFGKEVEFVYLSSDDLPTVDAAQPSPYIGPIVGGALLQHAGGSDNCTSGFAAYRYGVKGVLSAGHCSRGLGLQRFLTNTGEVYPLGSPTGNKALYMDLEFFPVTTSKPLSPRFYNDNQQFIGVGVDRIAGPNDYLLNDWVCHSGRTSGQAENGGVLNKRGESCGRITGTERGISMYGCNGWTNIQPCEGRSFIVVSGQNGTNLRSYGGDSGGPWYKTTSSGEVIAMGIHSGSSKTTIGEIYTTAKFSPIYLAYDLGGITIPTTRDYD